MQVKAELSLEHPAQEQSSACSWCLGVLFLNFGIYAFLSLVFHSLTLPYLAMPLHLSPFSCFSLPCLHFPSLALPSHHFLFLLFFTFSSPPFLCFSSTSLLFLTFPSFPFPFPFPPLLSIPSQPPALQEQLLHLASCTHVK